MTDEEIAVKIAEHENRIKVSEHRIEDLEEQQKYIQELTISVKELAISLKNMVAEQKSQGERIKLLEDEPGKNWKTVKTAVMTTIIGTVFGAVAMGLISLAVNYL